MSVVLEDNLTGPDFALETTRAAQAPLEGMLPGSGLRLIGIRGAAGAGKDTLAEMICRRFPDRKICRFAGTLRTILSGLTGIPVEKTMSADDKAAPVHAYFTMSGLLQRLRKVSADILGCPLSVEKATQIASVLTGIAAEKFASGVGADVIVSFLPMTVGRLLQVLGTECFRVHLHNDIWVQALFSQWGAAGSPPAVITDVRFPDESAAVRRAGGFVVLIQRPDAKRDDGRDSSHASETSLVAEAPDFVIENTGSLAELEEKLVKLWPLLSKNPLGESPQ